MKTTEFEAEMLVVGGPYDGETRTVKKLLPAIMMLEPSEPTAHSFDTKQVMYTVHRYAYCDGHTIYTLVHPSIDIFTYKLEEKHD